MVDQEKIHNQCLSDNPEERIHALEELKNFFSSMPDKQQAWNDLHRLTYYRGWNVRSSVASAIGSTFSHVPDKQQAWGDLIGLTNDEDWNVRSSATLSIGSAFSHVQDKQQAWDELHRLTNDEDSRVRSSAAYALGSAFSQVPDKQQAWDDLLRLTSDKDFFARENAVEALDSAFSQVPDKQQAWNDLLRLTKDTDWNVSQRAAEALCSAFSQVPDKQQAWNDLYRLANDKDPFAGHIAVKALDSVFSQVPDKQQAWNDLLRLTNHRNILVDFFMKSSAAYALGSAFSQVPDKQQAWNGLHRLTNDEDWNVRSSAAYALGSAFFQVPDKQQAWNDLIKLTTDEDRYVRSSSNYSLGRVSIFMASHAETDEDYKKELEKAIEFFEIAVQESILNNSAQFCLPFYRSFYTIIFKRQETREEVNKYLEEAKSAIEGSKNKELLFEAVKNLAEALKEVENMGNLALSGMKNELNFYRKYCDQAAELMKFTDEKAPFATEVMRKGLPILDRNIKRILEEIQEKAKTACKVSQGTTTKEIACTVSREVQKWEIGGNQEEVAQKVEDIAYMLKIKVVDLPENEYFLNKIESIRHEVNLIKQLETLSCLIGLIPTVKVVPEDVVMKNINKMDQNIETKLDSLSQEMNEIRISLSPGIKQEIEISSGIEIVGTGAALITTIPLQEISYAELKEDLQRIKGEHISKLSEIPRRLANKIKGYLLLKDREDIVEQLT